MRYPYFDFFPYKIDKNVQIQIKIWIFIVLKIFGTL